MKNEAYAWNDLIWSLKEAQSKHGINCEGHLTIEQKLNIANSKLASIELVMDEYYTGSFTTIEELAGEISFVLNDEE